MSVNIWRKFLTLPPPHGWHNMWTAPYIQNRFEIQMNRERTNAKYVSKAGFDAPATSQRLRPTKEPILILAAKSPKNANNPVWQVDRSAHVLFTYGSRLFSCLPCTLVAARPAQTWHRHCEEFWPAYKNVNCWDKILKQAKHNLWNAMSIGWRQGTEADPSQ